MTGIKRLCKKAQTTAEYAVLIGLVIAAAMAMQIYVKRALQAKVHDASDRYYDELTGTTGNLTAAWANISNATGVGTDVSKQYEPDKLERQSSQISTDSESQDMFTGGRVTRGTQRDSSQKIGDYQKWDY